MNKHTFTIPDSRLAILLVAPSVILVIALIIYPLLYNIYLSFFHIQLDGTKDFLGLGNYERLFTDRQFYDSISKTAIFLFGTILCTTILGIAAAQLLCLDFVGNKFVKVTILIPYFVPVVSIVYSWKFFFDPVMGVFNYYMVDILHIWDHHIGIISDPKNALWVVIAFDTWKHFPIAALLIMAKMQSIPKDLYEAAVLDGADAWQRFRYITLPNIYFVVGTVVILRFIWNLNVFDTVYLMSSNVHTLSVFTYLKAFSGSIDQGFGASISVIQLIFLGMFIYFYVKKILKW